MKMREAEEKVRALVDGPIQLAYERWDHEYAGINEWETECRIWIQKLKEFFRGCNWRQAVVELEIFLANEDPQAPQSHPDEETV